MPFAHTNHSALFPGEQRPLVFGHRGYSAEAPENTMAAFSLCLERGVPGIEIDIHLCKSGELVVIHDHNLKQTTGIDKPVEEATWEEMKDLDAGSFFGAGFSGQTIPLLTRIFETYGDKFYYDVEIKEEVRGDSGIAGALKAVIDDFDIGHRVMVSSFNPFPLLAFRKLTRKIPTAVIYSTSEKVPPILRHGAGRFIAGSRILKPNRKQVTSGSIFFLKTISRHPIIPWTVDDPEEAEKLVQLGADGIISNRPSEIMEKINGHR